MYKIKSMLVLAFTLAASFVIKAQNKIDPNQFFADSIFIYKGFTEHGTTASLWHNHRKLDSMKSEKVKLNAKDMHELIFLFKEGERKKLFQQKYGGDICYLLVYRAGTKEFYVFQSGEQFTRIDNLADMHCWYLKDPAKRKKFHDLMRKYWP